MPDTPRFRVVFDDLEAAARLSDNPAVQRLSFGITFPAESMEQAEQIMREAPEMERIGKWHIEEPHDA